jgi:hypothetical protein
MYDESSVSTQTQQEQGGFRLAHRSERYVTPVGAQGCGLC